MSRLNWPAILILGGVIGFWVCIATTLYALGNGRVAWRVIGLAFILAGAGIASAYVVDNRESK